MTKVVKKVFFKKKDKFSTFLHDIATNLLECMNYFADFKLNHGEDLKTFSTTMKEYERYGDTIVHNVIQDLNKVFITPIEREDILALANHMDDVVDGLEHTASFFEMFSITVTDEHMVQFITILQQAVAEIEKAVVKLTDKKLLDMREHAIEIKEYESQCDEIYRSAIKHLFEREKDPIRIVQLKEIYEELEHIADCCENVAHTLEAIIMKNA